jgi:hypothetical protein
MKNFKLILLSISILIGISIFIYFNTTNKIENFMSRKNKEDVQRILNTDGLSYSEKISKIKSLKLKDYTINDLIFNYEKNTYNLIVEYMKTDIPEKS